jgi:hypothetical protein
LVFYRNETSADNPPIAPNDIAVDLWENEATREQRKKQKEE